MAASALLSSPAALATRRAGAARPAPVAARASCRPGSSFRPQGNPFFGFQQPPGRACASGGSSEAWRDLFKAAEQAFGGGSSAQDWQQAAQKWQGMAQTAAQAMAFPVDIVESATEYVLTADVPGLSKGDLKIRVNEEARTLTISGERRRPQAATVEGRDDATAESREEAAPQFSGKRTFERRMGSFERTFNLSKKADAGAVSARVEKGVLTLTVLKKERDEPQVKDVPIWD